MAIFPRQLTASTVLKGYHAQYHAGIKSGDYHPLLYPWITSGVLLVVVYLLIPNQRSPLVRKMRLPVFGLHAWHAFYTMRYCRSMDMAITLAAGLISAWSMIWIAVLLIVKNPQDDFCRIKRDGVAYENSSGGQTSKQAVEEGKARRVHDSNINTSYKWQTYPIVSFFERVDWVTDLVGNLRGVHWNWCIPGLPEPPKFIQEQLRVNTRPKDPQITQNVSFKYRMAINNRSRAGLIRDNLLIFLRRYMEIDLLKIIILHDPYFWGIMDGSRPGWLPSQSPAVLTIYRLLVCQFCIKFAIDISFSLGPIFFVGMLGPNRLGVRGEPWMYSEPYGSYTNVLDKGLAGWWGGWWHQSFRYAFDSISVYMTEHLGIERKSTLGKWFRLLTAFVLSGFLHASGSYTMFGETRPINSFIFFIVQPFGIIAELMLRQAFTRVGLAEKVPKRVQQAITLVYVHLWLFVTAPFLCDDFARGGIFLVEPLPVSPLRALGLGAQDSTWWCWPSPAPSFWVKGNKWWTTGIRL